MHGTKAANMAVQSANLLIAVGARFDGRHSETDLSDNPEFVSVANAFGIPGRKIFRKDQVIPALEEMLAAKGSWLLHACIDERENVWPLVPPGAANHEMMEEHP